MSSNVPILDALKELKFGRPAWTQKMLDRFIKDAESECFKNEGDGTFNHIVDDVWEKGQHEKD